MFCSKANNNFCYCFDCIDVFSVSNYNYRLCFMMVYSSTLLLDSDAIHLTYPTDAYTLDSSESCSYYNKVIPSEIKWKDVIVQEKEGKPTTMSLIIFVLKEMGSRVSYELTMMYIIFLTSSFFCLLQARSIRRHCNVNMNIVAAHKHTHTHICGLEIINDSILSHESF